MQTPHARMAAEQQDQLYGVWRPVWTREEAMREDAWEEVLRKNTIRESGVKYDLADLAEMGLQDVITQAQHSDADELSRTIPALVWKGFPMAIRGLGWKHLLDVSVRRHRGHYSVLVQQSLGDLASLPTLTVEDIRGHLAQVEASQTTETAYSADPSAGTATVPAQGGAGSGSWHPQAKVWLQQIEKDLPRTFSGHPVMEGAGRQALRRVLAAFAMHDPVVGYCQGMNFIAAVLLMFMSEEDAFWCLVIMVEDVLTGYFSPDMMATKVDQRVFQQLVTHQLPAVAVHLEAVGADLACVAPQWFLCAFVNSLPLETCLRVWDVMFYRKTSAILFQVGLALVDVYSDALLAARDVLEAFQVVQGMAALTHDASHLLAVAMVKFSTLDDQHLATLRAQAQAQVEKQEAEDERAEMGRQLRQQQVATDSAIKQPALQPAQQPAISVVKKLLARLEKRTDTGGGKGSDSERARPGEGAERQTGTATDPTGASGDSDSDQDPIKGRKQEAPGGSGGRGQSKRAGNHTVPDSNDSPLLKVAGMSVSGDGPSGVGVVGVKASEDGDEGEEGSYVPPSVPLFPEAKELISLSPSESTALPDIDDLLRISSMRRGEELASAARAAQQQQPQKQQGTASAAAGSDAGQLGGTLQGSRDAVTPAAGGEVTVAAAEGCAPAPSAVVGRALLDQESASGVVEESPPRTPAGMAKDSRLQQLDAMLWHETPPWKSLQQFSAAQRGEDAPDASAPGAPPSSTDPAGGQEPQADAATEGVQQRPQDAPGRTSAPPAPAAQPQPARPQAFKHPQPAQPALSPAMQIAIRIAMHRPEDPPRSPPPPAPPAVPTPGTSSRPATPQPAPQPLEGPSAWRQAGWGLEVVGSALSGRSLGVSSVPTEDLENLHLSGQHPGAVVVSGGGVTGSLGGGVGQSGAELKDDWVDLHVGEDMVAGPQHSMRGWLPSGPQPPQQLFGNGNLSSSAITFALPPPHPLRPHPSPPQQGAHHHSTANSGELRKTISNGWVDGALPPHPSLVSQSSNGAAAPALHPAVPPLHLGVPTYLMPHMLAPLDREGLSHPGAGPSTLSSGRHAGGGTLEATRLQAGLSVSSMPAPEALEELCEREGIQPLLARCHALNGQYKRVEAGRAGADKAGASDDDDKQALTSRSLAKSHSGRTLDKQSMPSTHPATSNYHRLLSNLLQHVDEALSHATEAVRAPADGLDTATSTSPPPVNEPAYASEVRTEAPPANSQRQSAAAALFSLQVAHQQLSEALEDIGQAEQVEQELLTSYRSLANASCQKLHDVAGALAEREAVVEALSHKLAAVTQVYIAKEEQWVDKVSDQEDAIRDMQQRLAIMATNGVQAAQGAGAGGGGAGGEANRLIGAFQKLRERGSRPSSPPVRRNGSNTPPLGVHPLLVSQIEHPGYAGNQAAPGGVAAADASGQSSSSGLPTGGTGGRADDGAREEGRVTKWLNRFISDR